MERKEVHLELYRKVLVIRILFQLQITQVSFKNKYHKIRL